MDAKLIVLIVLSVFLQEATLYQFKHGLHQTEKNDFMSQYAMMKLYESCFGSEVVNMHRKKMKQAVAICMGQPSMSAASYGTTLFNPSFIKPVMNPSYPSSNNYPNYFGFPSYTKPTKPNYGTLYPQSPMFTYPNYQNSYNPSYGTSNLMLKSVLPSKNYKLFTWNQPSFQQHSSLSPSRFRRSPGDKFANLKDSLMDKINNVSCVLEHIGIIDENKNIDIKGIKMMIKNLNVEPEMTTELYSAVDSCRAFSQCMPIDRFTPIAEAKKLAPAMMFCKCFRGRKMEACVKQDLRKKFISYLQGGMEPAEVEQIISRANQGMQLPESMEEMEEFMQALTIGNDISTTSDLF